MFTLLLVFALGCLSGLMLSPLKTKPMAEHEYVEGFEIAMSLRTSLQKTFLNFYVNEYCEGEDTRLLDYQADGVLYNIMYCGKNTTLVLDGFPPLPIAVMQVINDE